MEEGAMGFREMIKQVQLKSGFSDREAKEALEHMVESISVRLTDDERKDFASQLPQHLQDISLSVRATYENTGRDIIEDFMRIQNISEARAKKQVLASWEVIKDTVTPGEIEDVRAQLPQEIEMVLH